MTEKTLKRLPEHLKRYVVSQNYERYTPEDQAVWRFIMRQLKSFLSKHAHESYLSGLEKTGLSVEEIPHIDRVDEHLQNFGWGALPVSGFIPPAAFMEFQALGLLPIASDMRTIDHLTYTPAPDIVHEAAGHAPILANPEYAAYLLEYGDVARNSIISKQDLDQYEAIRVLSDIKENPDSSPAQIENAERQLEKVNSSITGVSEAALLSRMNWWTAEYGLIGDLKNPKIFGAGLLSSVGESAACLRPEVRKIPLSVDCVNYSYDITEQQPHLFVTRDFAQLSEVLEKLSEQLSYRRGGTFGLKRAIEAQTVNSVKLNSGLQISGILQSYIPYADRNEAAYLRFEGPCQLSAGYKELAGQGIKRHAQGFSSPVGLLRGQTRCLSEFKAGDLEKLGLRNGSRGKLEFASGVVVEGVLKEAIFAKGKLVILTWTDCRAILGGQVLFDPAWGEFDMAVGSEVVSVFGGPADRSQYGETEGFVNRRVPERQLTSEQRRINAFYQALRDLRIQMKEPNSVQARTRFNSLLKDYLGAARREWLHGVELLEFTFQFEEGDFEREQLLEVLKPEYFPHGHIRQSVSDGIQLANYKL